MIDDLENEPIDESNVAEIEVTGIASTQEFHSRDSSL
jgi:hypothetical protein